MGQEGEVHAAVAGDDRRWGDDSGDVQLLGVVDDNLRPLNAIVYSKGLRIARTRRELGKQHQIGLRILNRIV